MPDDGFADHAVSQVTDRAAFDRLAAGDPSGTQVLKFVITGFADPDTRAIHYLEGDFYELHDEWFWFRLLNGARVPGVDATPVSGTFADPRAVAQWAREQTTLPLGLRLVDGARLYSDRFYELAMDATPRTLGVGSVVHMPAHGTGEAARELWAFELQYRDSAEEHELTIFLDTLRATLPAEIAEQLVWVVRSPEQQAVARRLRERGRPMADRIVDYAQLALPGALEVYSPGLVAGRLRSLRANDPRLAETTAADILLFDAVPDFLPPACGVVTATPQTPLSHVAILARNRGIPNAYLGGASVDPNLQQLARVHAPVVVHASSAGLRIHPIDEPEYRRWQTLRRPPVRRIGAVDTTRIPYTIDLAAHRGAEPSSLAPVIGGKSSGMLVLAAAGVEAPPRPLAITIRAYAEHLAPLRRTIEGVLADAEFRASPAVRHLVLEGPEAFIERFGRRDWVDGFRHGQTHGSTLRAAVAGGGLRQMIRELPVAPATLGRIEAAVRAQFSGLASSQGLRFRSSSTAEDVEGFTGAGLYVSSTGFLDPRAAPDPEDRDHDVGWALRRTWASYWSAEAFEERELAGIPHLDGNMAVLVHPRFDDALERTNGVLTWTVFPPGSPVEAVADIVVQAGSTSVTNPPSDRAVRPERIRWTRQPGGATRVERISRSSEVAGGGPVLTDEEIGELAARAHDVGVAWLAVDNRARPLASARRGVVLDLEFRHVHAGWPAAADPGAATAPPRLIVKQVRSLEPGLPADLALQALPIPREILARARSIDRRSCRGGSISADLLEVTTDPLREPDLGHSVGPFVAAVEIRGLARTTTTPTPGVVALTHLEVARTEHRGPTPSSMRAMVKLSRHAAEQHAFDTLEIDPRGSLRLTANARLVAVDSTTCTLQPLLAAPDQFLLELLAR